MRPSNLVLAAGLADLSELCCYLQYNITIKYSVVLIWWCDDGNRRVRRRAPVPVFIYTLVLACLSGRVVL